LALFDWALFDWALFDWALFDWVRVWLAIVLLVTVGPEISTRVR
jgi:hypothetical protein